MNDGKNFYSSYQLSLRDYSRFIDYQQDYLGYGIQPLQQSETLFARELAQSDENLPIIEIPDIGNNFEEVAVSQEEQLDRLQYSFLDPLPNPTTMHPSNFSDLFSELDYPPKQGFSDNQEAINQTQVVSIRKYPDMYSCMYMSGEEQAEMRRRQQRVNATTRERNRMRCLDQAFRNLARFLPDLPRNRKASKQEILSGAIRHIGYLEKTLDIKVARKTTKSSEKEKKK